MTEGELTWAKAMADVIQTSEDATDDLARLVARTQDTALTEGLLDIVRHHRIEILRMQCHLAELCNRPPGSR